MILCCYDVLMSQQTASTMKTVSGSSAQQGKVCFGLFKVGEPEMCPCRHHDSRTSAAALSNTRYFEAGHVARTDTTEGQGLL